MRIFPLQSGPIFSGVISSELLVDDDLDLAVSLAPYAEDTLYERPIRLHCSPLAWDDVDDLTR